MGVNEYAGSYLPDTRNEAFRAPTRYQCNDAHLKLWPEGQHLHIERHDNGEAFLWLWGTRFEIRSLEAKSDEPDRIYEDVLHSFYDRSPRRIVLGVREAPEPAPPPPAPRRRWSTTMGLRTPK